MDEEAFSQFITQTLGLSEDSVLQFYIITIGMKSPKLGHVKFENYEHLFKFMGKYNLSLAQLQNSQRRQKVDPENVKIGFRPKNLQINVSQFVRRFPDKELVNVVLIRWGPVEHFIGEGLRLSAAVPAVFVALRQQEADKVP